MANHKKDSSEKKKESYSRVSLQPNHLLIPNGTLLRGVPVQTGGEYKVPVVTDHHTLSSRPFLYS